MNDDLETFLGMVADFSADSEKALEAGDDPDLDVELSMLAAAAHAFAAWKVLRIQRLQRLEEKHLADAIAEERGLN